MLNDSIQMLDGATINNLVVASGTSFPGSVQAGEMFFRTDVSSMYIWTGAAWQIVGAGASPAAGSEGSVQINTSSVFAGGGDLVFNTASNTLTLGETGETGIVSGLPSATGTKGGNITVTGGGNSSTGQGGDVSIVGGDAAASNGGSIILAAGHRIDNAAGQGEIILKTWNAGSLTERLRILSNGAWSVGTNGAAYGTSGQVLTSNGNAAPTWSTATTANISGGSTKQIPFQTGAGVTGFSSDLQFDNSSKYLAIGIGATNSSGILYLGNGSGVGTVSHGGVASGNGGTTVLAGGPGVQGGGNAIVQGALAGTNGWHGGSATIRGGDGLTSGAGGAVNINGGLSGSGAGGAIIISTATSSSLIERLRISNTGGFGLSGANYGTSGQVLTSAGNAPPTWGSVSTVAAGVTDGTYELGWKVIPQNSQSAAYTLVLADSGKHILHPSADTTARTFTIPANSSVAYPVGTAVTIINQNAAGVITIAITTDTMRLAGAGTTGSRTLAANGVATAIKITSTEWIISGTNLT